MKPPPNSSAAPPWPSEPAAGQALGTDEVHCSLPDRAGLPLRVEPRGARLRADPDHAFAWLVAHLTALETLLARHGAVLMRGFAVPDTAAFGRLTGLHPPHAQGYVAGATPRAVISGHVHESTRMPPAYRIGLHQEMAYLPDWPRLLAFYCHEPPTAGGETPLADMRAVTRRLAGETLDRFSARGVMYRRQFCLGRHPSLPPGFYHQTLVGAFMTEDRNRIEKLCADRELACEWLADGSLVTTHVGPATVRHPRTFETLWFNQASTQHLNPTSVGRLAMAALARTRGARRTLPCEIRFGDGGPMREADLLPVYRALDAEETCFAWQRGDVLWVDNVRVAHGRRPFRGPRDIQVALLD